MFLSLNIAPKPVFIFRFTVLSCSFRFTLSSIIIHRYQNSLQSNKIKFHRPKNYQLKRVDLTQNIKIQNLVFEQIYSIRFLLVVLIMEFLSLSFLSCSSLFCRPVIFQIVAQVLISILNVALSNEDLCHKFVSASNFVLLLFIWSVNLCFEHPTSFFLYFCFTIKELS